MAGPALDLGLEGGRWRLYRDPPRPPPVGVAVEGNGGDALISAREVLGIVGEEYEDPSHSKSNRLLVDIFRFCFNVRLRYIL